MITRAYKHADGSMFYVNTWDVQAIAREAYSLKPHPNNNERCNAPHFGHVNSETHDHSWYGGLKTQAEATALFTEGWESGAKRLEGIAQEVTPPEGAKSRKRRIHWRDEGDELSVDRAIAGQWDDAWRSSKREWSDGPTTVDLYAVFGGACSRTSDELFWAGATACVLADLLENAGYSVSVVGGFLHTGSGEWSRTDVVLKQPTDPLRIDALASVLCHAGVFRTYGFRLFSQNHSKLNFGLGPCEYEWLDSTVQLMRECEALDKGAIVLRPAYTRSDCIAEINRILKLITIRSNY